MEMEVKGSAQDAESVQGKGKCMEIMDQDISGTGR